MKKIQRCSECDEPTGHCEDDAIYDAEGNIVCEECYDRNPLNAKKEYEK